MPEDLDIHLQTEPHFAPEQMMPMETEYPQPMQQMPRWMNAQPQEHSIHCNYFECNAYQDWPAQHQQDQQYQHQQEMDYAYHQQMMQMQQHHLQMHMPMIVGYNGPEVENLNWSGDKILKSSMPVGGAYPVLKRQRLDYHIHA